MTNDSQRLNSRMKRIARMLWLCIIGLGLSLQASGQVIGNLTNEELNLQKLFIDAHRETLLGAHDKAASIYQEVLNQDPENDAAAYELSRVYETMGEYDEALAMIDQAIKINDGNSWYFMMKGDIMERMEEYGGAIDVYKHLTSLENPENYYYQHLIDLYLKTNQVDTALVTLEAFELHAGVLPDIIRAKVDILEHLNQHDRAIGELEKLVDVYPGYLQYLHLVAQYCERAGYADKAKTYYEQIIAIDPYDARANIVVADQYKSQGAESDYLRSIIPLMQNTAIDLDVKVQELIPYVAEYAQNPDTAIGPALGEAIQELVVHHKSDAKVHALYADFLYYNGQPFDAINEYEKTLVLDKGVFDVWEQLMYIQAEVRDMDGVIRTANQAMEVFPNQAAIYYLSGLAYASKNDYQESKAQLQQALIMSGRNAQLRFEIMSLLGTVYLELNQDDKAFEAFDKALALQPDNVSTLNTYSYYLAQKARSLASATEMAQKALQLSPGNADIEHTLAFISFQQGDFTQAKTFIEKAMDHGGGDDIRTLEHYGDILYSLEDVDTAVEYWILSQERGNSSELLKRKILERKLVH